MELVPAKTLGSLDVPDLAAAMRPLWEDAGPLVQRLVGVSVASWAEHIERAEAVIRAMDEPSRMELLRAHPRIGSPPRLLAGRSRTSLAEQGGIDEDPAVLARLDALNETYEATFGFPFVERVAGRSRTEMCEVMRKRCGGDRTRELSAGCDALIAIARDRLLSPQSSTGDR